MLSVEYLHKLRHDERLQDIEWETCRKDPYYFLVNWAKTLDPHDDEQPIKPFPDKEYLKIITEIWLKHNLLLVPKSRQMMMSWLFTTLYLWDTIFHPARMTFFQSKKSEDADDILKRSKFVWDNLPKFLKRYYKEGKFYELKCNPQHKGQHVTGRMIFPDINSEIRAIPEGGDVIRMHVASGILCLGPKTKVLTSDLRWINADTVRIDNELAGFDENIGISGVKNNGIGVARQWRKTKVIRTEVIKRPSYLLEFDDGTKVISSKEHRWLAGYKQRHKWITTQNLRVQNGNRAGSKIIKLIDVWQEDNDYDTGYLAAAFDGEGCFYNKSFNNHLGVGGDVGISFSQNENKMLDTVRNILKNKGFNSLTEKVSLNEAYSTPHHTIRTRVRPEVMRFMGQVRPKRLLAKLDLDKWGTILSVRGVNLIKKEYIGEQEVIGITTTTGTFVAEGLASHNSDEMAFQPEARSAYTAAKPTISSKGRFTGISTAEHGTFFEDLVFDLIEV
jgi:hypothetical protein